MLWLYTLDKVPPQEFYYRQTEGIALTFPPTPLPKELAVRISDFRKANGLPRSDYSSCLVDIIQFTAQRLGPNTEWTFETDADPYSLLPPVSSGCSGCGANVTMVK